MILSSRDFFWEESHYRDWWLWHPITEGGGAACKWLQLVQPPGSDRLPARPQCVRERSLRGWRRGLLVHWVQRWILGPVPHTAGTADGSFSVVFTFGTRFARRNEKQEYYRTSFWRQQWVNLTFPIETWHCVSHIMQLKCMKIIIIQLEGPPAPSKCPGKS